MVKSMTVPGKCYAISDGDRQDDPILNDSNDHFDACYCDAHLDTCCCFSTPSLRNLST